MLILLSPAKTLNMEPAPDAPAPTAPRFAKETAALAAVLKRKTGPELAALMSLSDDLAGLNRERFKAFGEQARKQAILAFAGDVYRGLDASSLDADTIRAAQERIRILSGLYGLLRPLDAIEPYRLEMGTRLKTKGHGDLYGFWDGRIAEAVEADLEGHGDRTVVNLASNEYFKAANGLTVPVVTPVFKEEKDGQMRTLALFAKTARGMMARYAAVERIDRAEELKGFTGGGYRYAKSLSDGQKFVFTRKQPPKKG